MTPPPFSAPSREDISKFFTDFSQYGFFDLNQIYPVQVYNERLIKGDPGLVYLKERMGFFRGEDTMVFQKSKAEVFHEIYLSILEAAQKHSLSREDILIPTFVLSRKTVTGENELLYLRIGIDLVPPKSEGWTWAQGILTAKSFSESVALGYLIIDAGAFTHDFGHILDTILNPVAIAEFRRLQKLRLASPKAKHMNDDYDFADLPFVNSSEYFFKQTSKVDIIINEFLSLPSLSSSSKERLSRLFGLPLDQISSSGQIEKFLATKTEAQLIELAQLFLKEEYSLYQPHGGALRDISTYQVAIRFPDLKIKKMVDGKSLSSKSADTFSWVISDLIGDLFRLKDILRYFQGQSNTSTGEAVNLTPNPQARAVQLLRQNISRIYFRTWAVFKTEITPEQIVRDTQLMLTAEGRKKYLQSPTYRFYKMISEPGTAQHILFVQPFEH